MTELLNQLREDIQDIFKFGIETTNSYTVPTRDDPGLTFPIGNDKKGKLIKTCVLFVDIRNSTGLSRSLRKDKIRLGKIYSAFIHAMATIADEYGYVRNIVGDRIMVVFEPRNCFKDAIKCAALMFGVARELIAPHCLPTLFKVGIGIDFGEMLILKTGIRKKHEEQSEYKNLVWIGDTANIASKLTDFANKDLTSSRYKIIYQATLGNTANKSYGTYSLFDIFNKKLNDKSNILSMPFSDFAFTKSTELATIEDLHNEIKFKDGSVFFKNKKVDSIEIESSSITTRPVLMSGQVYRNFTKLHPSSSLLIRFSKREYPNQPYTGSGIYGGGFTLKDLFKIK